MTNTPQIILAVIAFACGWLSACSPTGPDVDTILSVSYNTSGEAPSQTLTVDAKQVRFVSSLPQVPRFNYDTTVADASFINDVRSHIELSIVIALADKVDQGKLAVDYPLHTLSITYQRKGEFEQSTKVIKFADPAHDELLSLYNVLSRKATQLRR